MEIMMLGDEFSVDRAYQVGLVNKIVPEEELMPAARAYARRLADNAPLVLEMFKMFAGEILPSSPMERASHAMRVVEKIMASDDFREGFESNREKRKPRYTGK